MYCDLEHFIGLGGSLLQIVNYFYKSNMVLIRSNNVFKSEFDRAIARFICCQCSSPCMDCVGLCSDNDVSLYSECAQLESKSDYRLC
jgi:hypothetical protein